MRTVCRRVQSIANRLNGRERSELEMSDSGISRRDLVRRGGLAAAAGASLWGLSGCARRDEVAQGGADVGTGSGGVATTGLVTRAQIRIEIPTHMEPSDPNTAIM